jgi:methylaspartate mutase S subunit
MAEELTIITGTVGSDSHSIGIGIVSRFLRDNGYKVVELRGLTPVEEFIEAARETDAVAIFISSLYGMAEIDLKGFKGKCIEAGVGDALLYLGGYLQVGRHDWKEDEGRYKAMGFDRVYEPGVGLDRVLEDLKEDLKKKGKIS